MKIKRKYIYGFVVSVLSVFMAHGAVSDLMTVRLKDLAGTEKNYKAYPCITVAALQEDLYTRCSCDRPIKRIVLNGADLEGTAVLSDAGVKDGTTLCLVAYFNDSDAPKPEGTVKAEFASQLAGASRLTEGGEQVSASWVGSLLFTTWWSS